MNIKPIGSSSAGNSYFIQSDAGNLLIECGLPIKKIRQGCGYKLHGIKGCLISHEHKDHCKSIESVIKYGIDCYLTQGTLGSLNLKRINHRIKVIEPSKSFKVADWNIIPFTVYHDAKEPVGFLLKSKKHKVLYASDTTHIKYKINGLTHVLIESNYEIDLLREQELFRHHKERVLNSHMSIQSVVKFFQKQDLSKLEEVWLIHLSDRNSDEIKFKQTIMEVTGVPVYVA